MAKSKRKSAVLSNQSANARGAKRQKTEKIPENTDYTPDAYYAEIFDAVDNLDCEKLDKFLALNVKAKYIGKKSSALYEMLAWPTDEKYAHKNAELLHCLNAILNDRRFTQVRVAVVEQVCRDQRQPVDILQALLRREHGRFRSEVQKCCYRDTLWAGTDRIMECLMHVPYLDVNYACVGSGGMRAVHFIVGDFWVTYNARMLPVILSDPRIKPDLRMRRYGYGYNRAAEYQTALAHADKTYAKTDDALKKKRAARNVRLLLADDRVDYHLMDKCDVDVGYAQVKGNDDA